MLIIRDFLSAFPKADELAHIRTDQIGIEPLDAKDRDKRHKYLLGMIAWCARLMNILVQPDFIED